MAASPGKPDLSPVFLDNSRVRLDGDPRPPVSKILEAGGKGASTPVLWVRAPDEDLGRQVAPDEVIDRTVLASEPVHLRSAALVQQSKGAGSGPGILIGSPREGPTEANSSGRSLESPDTPGEGSGRSMGGGGWNLEGGDRRTPSPSASGEGGEEGADEPPRQGSRPDRT